MKYLFIIPVILAVTLFQNAVFADGMIITPNIYTVHEPDQRVVIKHDGVTETIILQVRASGNAAELGWLVPVPSYPDVKEADAEIFEELKKLTVPIMPAGGREFALGGNMKEDSSQHVWVETEFIGIYEVNKIKADDSNALFKWLNDHNYHQPPEVRLMLDEYIKRGFSFITVRVLPKELEKKKADYRFNSWLDPLRIEFKYDGLFYPMKISSLNHGGTNLTLWVIAKHRMTFERASTQWGRWVEPGPLRDRDYPILADEVVGVKYLTLLNRNWHNNREIRDDIYLKQAPNNNIY